MKTLKQQLNESLRIIKDPKKAQRFLSELIIMFESSYIQHKFGKIWKDERSVDKFIKNYNNEDDKDDNELIHFIKMTSGLCGQLIYGVPSITSIQGYKTDDKVRELIDEVITFFDQQYYILTSIIENIVPLNSSKYSFKGDDIFDLKDLLKQNLIAGVANQIVHIADSIVHICDEIEEQILAR